MSYAHLLPYAKFVTPIMLVVGVILALAQSIHDSH